MMRVFLTLAAFLTYGYGEDLVSVEQENPGIFEKEQYAENKVHFADETNVGPTNFEDRVKDKRPLFGELSEKELNIRVILDRVFTGNKKQDYEAVRRAFGQSFDEDDRSILANYWGELAEKKRKRDVDNIRLNEELQAEEEGADLRASGG